MSTNSCNFGAPGGKGGQGTTSTYYGVSGGGGGGGGFNPSAPSGPSGSGTTSACYSAPGGAAPETTSAYYSPTPGFSPSPPYSPGPTASTPAAAPDGGGHSMMNAVTPPEERRLRRNASPAPAVVSDYAETSEEALRRRRKIQSVDWLLHHPLILRKKLNVTDLHKEFLPANPGCNVPYGTFVRHVEEAHYIADKLEKFYDDNEGKLPRMTVAEIRREFTKKYPEVRLEPATLDKVLYEQKQRARNMLNAMDKSIDESVKESKSDAAHQQWQGGDVKPVINLSVASQHQRR
ncbi:hypothetical protein AAVH_03275 [Aphelenchoides avenae]|nr:hypothetical protein AAVH_03275 [Aphelenchus avenae]